MLRTFALMMILLAVAACKNPCKDIDCGSHGSCNEGSCICETGYETDGEGRCSAEQRAKFVGMYSCIDQCENSVNDNYFCTIENSSAGIDKINIGNIYGFANNVVTATVSGSSFTVAAQTTADNFSIEGSGSLASNGLVTFNYTITRLSDNATDTCTLQMTKQ